MNVFRLVLLLIFTVQLQAQTCDYSITGVVRDFHDGSVLANSTLSVNGYDVYALSDFDGKYTLDGLCAGTYVITITHPECEVAEFTVEVQRDLQRDFKLEHHTEELNAVTVQGENLNQGTISGSQEVLKS
ncbi:MAG: carboxypeptidase-like regulatory domain-containing protein, partial [Bacteroidota bacterium]|nr:carboxypeptidase-like regulatory domain-containing protein [Bacteroidota bacterium]